MITIPQKLALAAALTAVFVAMLWNVQRREQSGVLCNIKSMECYERLAGGAR